MDHALIFLVLACVFGFFMSFGIGANDVANAVGTAVGSKSLTVKQAIIIAAIFEMAGAILAGGEVTMTVGSGLLNTNIANIIPEYIVYGMLASLLASGTWLLIASHNGWPVSTTHSIVGAIIGFAWIELGNQSIKWSVVADIVGSWIVTPFMSGVIAYFTFISILRLMLQAKDPIRNAKRYLPVYVFLVALVMSVVTFTKGLAHTQWHMSLTWSISLSIIVSLGVMIISIILLNKSKMHTAKTRSEKFAQVEKIFSILMIFTACAMAFAHGSNDIANAIGPMAAIFSIVKTGTLTAAQNSVPVWILLFGAVGLVLGLAVYGHKVIATIGNNITDLTPSRGFAASFATATTVVIASGAGLPISTTQTLVGAVMGVGYARGISALNLRVIRSIFMSWIITLPAGAVLTILYFVIIKFLFSL